MPPAYVKPYVKRQKNDATDAEAICEAVTRTNMRFVPTKTAEQQSGLVLHRARHLFIRQQTAVINAIRGHLAEFGIVAPVGRHGVEELLNVVTDPNDKRVPDLARECLLALGAQLRRIKEQILEFDRLIRAWHRANEMSMSSMKPPASVRCWPRLWWLPLPIQCPSDQGELLGGGTLGGRVMYVIGHDDIVTADTELASRRRTRSGDASEAQGGGEARPRSTPKRVCSIARNAR